MLLQPLVLLQPLILVLLQPLMMRHALGFVSRGKSTAVKENHHSTAPRSCRHIGHRPRCSSKRQGAVNVKVNAAHATARRARVGQGKGSGGSCGVGPAHRDAGEKTGCAFKKP